MALEHDAESARRDHAAVTNTAVGLFPVLASEAQSALPLCFAITLAGLFALALIVRTNGRLAYDGRAGLPVGQVEPVRQASRQVSPGRTDRGS